ncbi:hypothetical protein [Chondromyces crocatus]|uniref:Uncharacterized protein n=1 Tax=Chondromyces crocatus TaxID=52 RepID=A0A0K1ESR9_CHOCO|nr:hypothetical protein [Chondromyces crocatus]AKT43980.1 uncharacterized protein CMC5_082180 [Chondromyces crocatus]
MSATNELEDKSWSAVKLVGLGAVTLVVVFTILFSISPFTPKLVFNPSPWGHLKPPIEAGK